MEILLLHPGALGDIILSLPAVAVLRTKYPAARITFAANVDHVAPIMGVYMDNAISLASLPLHNLYSDEPVPPQDLKLWTSFDRIISWTGAGDAGFIRRMQSIHPDACVASWQPVRHDPRHVSQRFVDSLGLELSSGKSAEPAPLFVDPEQSRQGLRWLRDRGWNGVDPLVTLHPGAGSKAKRWPLPRFISLARYLVLDLGRKLIIVEGPAECGLAAEVARELAESELIVADLPLNPLSAVIAHSGLFIGNDSGIAHLAAGLGVASIVLFGPTRPRHWAPLGRDVTVLWRPQGCQGCDSGKGEHSCLGNIAVEEVTQAVNSRRDIIFGVRQLAAALQRFQIAIG